MPLGEEQLGVVGALGICGQVRGEVGIATQHAALIVRPLERGDVERRQLVLDGLLGGVERGPHHGGRGGQRLGLVAPLLEILVHQRGDPQRDVLAPVLRLLLDRSLGCVAGQSGETDYQDQGDADAREEEALSELRGAAGHVRGVER